MTAPWVGALVALLAVVGWLGASVGGAALVRHRAAAAADLAALAAAQDVVRGQPSACRRADRVARANEAVLLRCEVSGLEASVVLRLEAVGPYAEAGLRSARAGLVTGPHR